MQREKSEELNKQTLQGRKKGSFSAAAGGGGGGAVSWLVVSYSYHQFNFGPRQKCSFEIRFAMWWLSLDPNTQDQNVDICSMSVCLDLIQFIWPGKPGVIPICRYRDFIVMRDIMPCSGQYNRSSVFVDACRGKFNVVWAPCWWKHKHSRMLTASWPIGNHDAEGGRVCVCVKVYSLAVGDRVMQKTCSRSVVWVSSCIL